MLFLTKKTMVAVLALGCLLSIAPKAYADVTLPSGRTVSAVVVAALAAYEGYREVDHSKKDKAAHLKAHDSVATYWQSALNFVTSKKGLVAVGGALAAYAVVKHGTAVKDLPAVQYVLSQVTPSNAPKS